jgi:hypothetical protein
MDRMMWGSTFSILEEEQSNLVRRRRNSKKMAHLRSHSQKSQKFDDFAK